MKYFCLIDDISCLDLGLKIVNRVNIPVVQRDTETIDIEGRNGSLIRDKGRWVDKEITIAFNFVNRDNFTQQCRLISKWLRGNKLKFSDDIDVFYKIKKIECDDIARSMKYKGSFNVKFTVDPFGWLEDGLNPIILTNSPSALLNLGTWESKPIIKVYGTGNITLFVNSTEIDLANVDSYIIIDSTIMDCYKDGFNCNKQMSGEFPVLQEGQNSIIWTGNVSKIEITPNWVYL
ncbi:phage tail family protein [Clostridium sp. 19966]|uniref:distal tail protein Dit n=1 Tax=Clostridium sp. 19966 TaxID=2768166 RepID=UPI0028DFC1BA|nr:distal tail protein Dit [Clostridium sp. 19966]MDT8718980.1 phage tail family protein [Clostridium sp. 19966]